MAIVYERHASNVGLYHYAKDRRDDASWYVRLTPFTRTGNVGEPSPWARISPDFALKLTEAVDPDNPPDKIEIDGRTYRHLKGYPVRLPR